MSADDPRGTPAASPRRVADDSALAAPSRTSPSAGTRRRRSWPKRRGTARPREASCTILAWTSAAARASRDRSCVRSSPRSTASICRRRWRRSARTGRLEDFRTRTPPPLRRRHRERRSRRRPSPRSSSSRTAIPKNRRSARTPPCGRRRSGPRCTIAWRLGTCCISTTRCRLEPTTSLCLRMFCAILAHWTRSWNV